MSIKINPPPLNPNAPDFGKQLVEVIRLMWVKLMGADGSSEGLPVSDGGTGADNASDARDNLGLTIGSDVQAHSAVLDATTASFTTADETKLDGIEAGAQVNTVTSSNSVTFTNKSVSLGTNTLTGTMAQFNTACSDGDFPFLGANNTFTGDNVFNGAVTLGDASGDTLTINAGTWTYGANYLATRAVGAAAAGQTVILDHDITATGDAGGTTNLKAWQAKLTYSGGNAAAETSAFRAQSIHAGSSLVTDVRGGIYRTELSSTGNATRISGMISILVLSSSGRVTQLGACFQAQAPTITSTGDFAQIRGFSCGNIGHATLVGEAISFAADDLTASATSTIGFRSEISSGTGKWGFRHTGTANNAFNGLTKFGAATVPINTVDINGSLGRGAPVTKTGNFTLAATENWIINNKSGSACVVTLPAASSWTGREVMIKNIQAQTVDSASSNVVPLAGGAAGTAILSATAGRWCTLVSDGSNWIQMQGVI